MHSYLCTCNNAFVVFGKYLCVHKPHSVKGSLCLCEHYLVLTFSFKDKVLLLDSLWMLVEHDGQILINRQHPGQRLSC